VNRTVPLPVRWVIDRCLAKAPRDRYASTEDLARDLATARDRLAEATSGSAEAITPAAPARAPRASRGLTLAAAFAAGLLVAGLGLVVWRSRSADALWKNPLSGARFTRLTDWEGSELDAAISPDGKFAVFLSDRDGPFDVWVTQFGNEFVNLSKGRFPSLLLDLVRNVAFAETDSHVVMRVGQNPTVGTAEDTWTIPTIGGEARPFLPKGVEIDWSRDRARTAYHTGDPGDPLFIADRTGGNGVKIYVDKPGIHNHYPTWSPDGRYVYFVHGIPTTFDMDIWRIRPAGGTPERITTHRARVTHPTFLDARTLLYTAPRPDGSGMGIYALDVERRIPHLVSSGLEEYLSVAADASGRRLVATVANPTSVLATVPISDAAVEESGVRRFSVPNVRAASPRYGPDFLLYLSGRGADALWKWSDGSATELWRPAEGSVAAAPAISATMQISPGWRSISTASTCSATRSARRSSCRPIRVISTPTSPI